MNNKDKYNKYNLIYNSKKNLKEIKSILQLEDNHENNFKSFIEVIGVLKKGYRKNEEYCWETNNLPSYNEIDLSKYKKVRLLVTVSPNVTIEALISGKGEPIVVLTGLGLVENSINIITDKLSNNYKVITVHCPGYGKSSRIKNLSYDGICNIIDKATNLLIKYSTKFHLVGTSLGGFISQVFASKYQSKLKSLTIVAGGYYLTDISYDGKPISVGSLANENFDYVIEKTNSSKLKENRVSYKNILTKFTQIDTLMAFKYSENILTDRETVKKILPTLKLPTLIIYGKYDIVVSKQQSLELANQIAHSKSIEIKKGSHFIFVTHQEKICKEILKFIA